MDQIQNILSHYKPIELSKIEEVALLRRVDTKFILQIDQLGTILEQIVDDYHILHVQNVSLQNYRTLYFDKPDFQFYFQHHNGKLNRHKIRIRKYMDSDLCYLEVKLKNNVGQTIKNRVAVPSLSQDISTFNHCSDTDDFMRQNFPCHCECLEPKLVVDFQRITLVSKDDIERVTVDLGLRFGTKIDRLEKQFIPDTGLQPDARLANLAIVEVKQERFSTHSRFLRQMRAAHLNIVPTSFSKYCVGTATLNPSLKANNFKRLFLRVQKVNDELP